MSTHENNPFVGFEIFTKQDDRVYEPDPATEMVELPVRQDRIEVMRNRKAAGEEAYPGQAAQQRKHADKVGGAPRGIFDFGTTLTEEEEAALPHGDPRWAEAYNEYWSEPFREERARRKKEEEAKIPKEMSSEEAEHNMDWESGELDDVELQWGKVTDAAKGAVGAAQSGVSTAAKTAQAAGAKVGQTAQTAAKTGMQAAQTAGSQAAKTAQDAGAVAGQKIAGAFGKSHDEMMSSLDEAIGLIEKQTEGDEEDYYGDPSVATSTLRGETSENLFDREEVDMDMDWDDPNLNAYQRAALQESTEEPEEEEYEAVPEDDDLAYLYESEEKSFAKMLGSVIDMIEKQSDNGRIPMPEATIRERRNVDIEGRKRDKKYKAMLNALDSKGQNPTPPSGWDAPNMSRKRLKEEFDEIE